MKRVIKAICYVVGCVLLVAFGLYIFHYHPEIQIAFLLPGIVLIIFSAFLNDFSRKPRLTKGK